MLLKKQLRCQMQERRLKLDPIDRQQYSQQVTERVISSRFFQNAQKIALYSACRGEVSTHQILAQALQQHKSCYLPVLMNAHLCFAKIDSHSQLTENSYGILEPDLTISHIIPPENLDLVLVPLVAFDQHCHRLGMGKGFYDKTFSFHGIPKHPKLVGLAYDFQKVVHLPRTKLDIKLDFIVTEKRIYFQ